MFSLQVSFFFSSVFGCFLVSHHCFHALCFFFLSYPFFFFTALLEVHIELCFPLQRSVKLHQLCARHSRTTWPMSTFSRPTRGRCTLFASFFFFRKVEGVLLFSVFFFFSCFLSVLLCREEKKKKGGTQVGVLLENWISV